MESHAGSETRGFPRRRLLMALGATGTASWFAYRISLASQMAFMLWVPVLLVVMVATAIRWRRGSGITLLACLCALPLGVVAGNGLRKADFWLWRKGRYEAIVQRIDSGDFGFVEDLDDESIDLSGWGAGLARRVAPSRVAPGVLRVEFLWDVGFPARHSCYVYCSSGRPCGGVMARNRYQALGGNWFFARN